MRDAVLFEETKTNIPEINEILAISIKTFPSTVHGFKFVENSVINFCLVLDFEGDNMEARKDDGDNNFFTNLSLF